MTATPTSQPFYAEIAQKLEAQLAELNHDLAEIDGVLHAELPADWEEQAQELEDQDALAGLEKSKRAEALRIKGALERIKTGDYGICIKCGDEIGVKRLQALPTAATCIKCAK